MFVSPFFVVADKENAPKRKFKLPMRKTFLIEMSLICMKMNHFACGLFLTQRKKDNSDMANWVCKAQQYTIKVLMFQTDFLNCHYSLFYVRFIQSSACLYTFPFGWAKLNMGCYERIHRQPNLFQFQDAEL